MTTNTSSIRKPPRKLDIDELFEALDEHELTASEVSYRFGVSKTYAVATLNRLTANGELLWSWDVRDGGGRRGRRFRPAYVRPDEAIPRSGAHRKQVADCTAARVIQLLHGNGEMTRLEIAAAVPLSAGHTSVVLAQLQADARISYRAEKRSGHGQRKRIYRLTSSERSAMTFLPVEVGQCR